MKSLEKIVAGKLSLTSRKNLLSETDSSVLENLHAIPASPLAEVAFYKQY